MTQEPDRARLPPLLFVLTFTTGIVDAVSYLGLGRVFTANMTGNVVLGSPGVPLAVAAALQVGAPALLGLGCRPWT